MDILRSYVARTGDVQSAALLFCSAAHLEQPPIGLLRFLSQYASLLARWRMYSQRAALHQLLTSKLPRESHGWQGHLTVLYCSNCRGPLTGPQPQMTGFEVDASLRRCPGCRFVVPSCAVCLLPVLVARYDGSQPSTILAGGVGGGLVSDGGDISGSLAVTWCQACRHGGHAAHLEDWFSRHTECPVPGCLCHCGG